MREIQFRAWDKKYKAMREENFTDPEDNDTKMLFLDTSGRVWTEGNSTGLDDASDRFIPIQYTGLKDENGKEIYEGDILECIAKKEYPENNKRDEVRFSDDSAFVVSTSLPLTWGGFVSLEIIGNIHENPELLNPAGK